jgi:CHASE2 domain-containing sensor protein
MSRKKKHLTNAKRQASHLPVTSPAPAPAATPAPARPHVSAVEHFGLGSFVLILAVLVSTAMYRTRMLDRLENFHLDSLFILQRKHVSDKIAIVWITNRDYKNLFNAISPLNPRIVSDIIGATARSGARIIAVDLDTSDWTAREHEAAASASRAGSFPRLVWARTGRFDSDGSFYSDPLQGLASDSCYGVPAVVPDQSRVVRRYRPFVIDQRSHLTMPGMPVVLNWLDRHKGGSCMPADLGESDEDRLIDFAGGGGDFARLTAEGVLAVADTAPWRNHNPLAGRIVLIGGAFSQARDVTATPVGTAQGVEVMANSVVSASQGILPIDDDIILAVDLAFGLAVLVVTFYWPGLWVLWGLTLGFPALLMLVSFASYTANRYFLSVVPVVVALILERLLEPRIRHTRAMAAVHRTFSKAFPLAFRRPSKT